MKRRNEFTSLVRHTDGNIAIDSDEHCHPDSRRLYDKDEREKMDERHLVAVVVIGGIPAGVVDQVWHAEYRQYGDKHQRVGHRQRLQARRSYAWFPSVRKESVT